ncbi:MAG: hypothetical protein K1X79_01010, partial [Oligoflexia bacterium]|nr:hypothetical protein [Oligoflexia bacterium]
MPNSKRTDIIFLLLLVTLAALWRYWGALGELGLDEIWSLRLIQPAHAPVDIFKIHHDNNHYLNSLWLWLCGAEATPLAMRGLSILCGVLSVIVGLGLRSKFGIIEARFFAVFLAFSYVFVLYGSEARGYS